MHAKIELQPAVTNHISKKHYFILSAIEEQAFQGMSQLTELTLNSNKLTTVKAGYFYGLTQLALLRLDENLIKCIENDAFFALTNLNELDLHKNKIEIINAYSPSLTRLNISLNRISAVNYDFVQNLTSLDLSNNYLDSRSYFYTQMFHETSYLMDSLDLSHNSFRSLHKDYFSPAFSSLSQLHLSHNGLTSVEDFAFENLVNLKGLHLDSNRLEFLSEHVFSNLNTLTSLYLGGNKLAAINVNLKPLPQLEVIDVTYNLLKSVGITEFQHNLNLKYSIADAAFKNLFLLRSFKFASNSLEFFELDMLNSEQIREIDLSANTITSNMPVLFTNIELLKLDSVMTPRLE